MNKKTILVVCAAAGLLIPALSFMSNRAIIKINAERTTYTMTLDEHNGPALTDSPSNGSFTVNTAGGNPIQFNYEGFVAASGNLASMLPSGSLTNKTALTGVFSVTASYMGTMGLYYGLTRADVNSIALTSGTEVELPIQACFISFKPLTAVTITSIQIKYECSLSAEAEEQKAMEAKRYELLDALEFEREDYRSDELDALDAVAAPIINDIMNADTMSELEAISLASFNTALANAKTNAQLMVEEAFNYRHLSEWALVNDHASTYQYQAPSSYVTGAKNNVGYLTSPYAYQGGFEMVMRCHSTAASAANFGMIIGNDNPAGNGLDGYMVSYNYTEGDHMYIQVFKLVNGYPEVGGDVIEFPYIGGWVYNRGTGDLRQDDIRVIYDGMYITLMNNDDYLNGLYDIKVVVDLNFNGYSITPGADYQFTFVNWDGDSAKNIEIKKLAMNDTVNSRDVACEIADEVIPSIDSTKFDSATQAQFNTLVDEIDALRASGTYAAIMAKVDEIKALKTPAQSTAATMLDNMLSGDPTKCTPSNWDAVNANVATWSHEAGTNSFTTNATAGYVMDAATHNDFMMMFRVDGVHHGNPYDASCTKGVLLGTNAAGYYFNGIMIALADDWGFQFYQMNADGSSGVLTPKTAFRGGFAVDTDNMIYKIIVQSGSVSVWLVDSLGNEAQLAGVGGAFANTNLWNVGVPAGHVGFVSWEGTTTFHLLEFQDL